MQRIRKDRQNASQRLKPLLEHIETHLFNPELNVDQLKRACGIRDNSISIVFHSEMGDTPGNYIAENRLDIAARLLRDTDLKVWRVAEVIGYSGIAVFSRAFERWAGQRPRAFRESVRKVLEKVPDQGDVLPLEDLHSKKFWRQTMSGELSAEQAQALIDRLRIIYGQPVKQGVGGPSREHGIIVNPGEHEKESAQMVWDSLQSYGREERKYIVRNYVTFHSPVLFEFLLAKGEEEGKGDPEMGAFITELAVDSLDGSAENLGEKLADLRTYGLARLAGACLLNGDTEGASRAIERAQIAWDVERQEKDRWAEVEIMRQRSLLLRAGKKISEARRIEREVDAIVQELELGEAETGAVVH
jgi:AraC-like DNA-binding protein